MRVKYKVLGASFSGRGGEHVMAFRDPPFSACLSGVLV
jgi:hypothetical protein